MTKSPLFPSFSLIGQPDNELPFLERVLAAAGYQEPASQLHLLRWTADEGGLDLARIVRRLQINKVMIFGQEAKAMGLHFVVAPYFPVEVAGVTYLLAPSVKSIADAKAKGDNGPAGALWRGIKSGFMRDPQQ